DNKFMEQASLCIFSCNSLHFLLAKNTLFFSSVAAQEDDGRASIDQNAPACLKVPEDVTAPSQPQAKGRPRLDERLPFGLLKSDFYDAVFCVRSRLPAAY
ncbi:hypothetical protein, partial [Geobacillus stearothermophilus]|uniref:hypothetical protein n=1 Tax=Geobacillus stearothermophilus TaxID=1422 RepID=UPI002402C6D6